MKYRLTALFLAAVFLLAEHVAAADVELVHIHGLGYSADGKQLVIPAHFGLAIYENGKWRKGRGPDHDYMGFSMTADRWYSSGHPAPGSSLINPFGLKRSDDLGKNWRELGMQGEADFHTLATGFNSNIIYVVNMMPNRTLMRRGLHYTRNDGKKWHYASAEGAPEPVALSVHPDKPDTLALASRSGLFLSTDFGNRFTVLDETMEVYAVSFDFNGKQLYYAGYDIAPNLVKTDLKSGKRAFLKLPKLERDAVSYISQNPKNDRELAIATFNRNVFISKDRGNTWKQIARQGKALNIR